MALKLNGIKIKQKDTELYVVAMKAGDLVANSKIDYWVRDAEAGYQRPLKESRLKGIANYLLKDSGTFPTSVLVNIRGEVDTKLIKALDSVGELAEISIPDKSLPFYVIDGQHRVEGLRAAIAGDKRLENYPVIISMFTFNDTYDEMMQFHVVNSRAKNVPTDLAQRHIFRMASKIGLPEVILREGERDALAAHSLVVVDRLIKDKNSPWRGRIQLPDESRKQEGEVIKQRPLADSIHFILKEKHSFTRDLDSLSKLLEQYWEALSEIFPEAFEEPGNYTIMKTTGVYSLHMVFPDVYDKCQENGAVTKETMEKVLKSMFEKASQTIQAEINSDFWSSEERRGHYLAQATSQKLIRALAEYFREALWE